MFGLIICNLSSTTAYSSSFRLYTGSQVGMFFIVVILVETPFTSFSLQEIESAMLLGRDSAPGFDNTKFNVVRYFKRQLILMPDLIFNYKNR